MCRCLRDIDYLKWSFNHLSSFCTDNGVREYSVFDKRTNKVYYGCRIATRSLPVFTDLYYKWYDNGIKVIPKDLKLTPLMIAVWFADDGSVSSRTKGALDLKFSTHCFSFEETSFLKDQLESMYGEFKVYKERNKEQYTIRCFTESAKVLLTDISSVFPPLSRKSNVWANLLSPKENRFCDFCKVITLIYKNGHDRNGNQRMHCQQCDKQWIIKKG